MMLSDGRVCDSGEIAEIEVPKRLVLKWRNELRPDAKAEGYSTCTIELKPISPGIVKLSIVHEIDKPESKLIEGVTGGWPLILSSLKSLLETGKVLEMSSPPD